jgi:hypothetical protein
MLMIDNKFKGMYTTTYYSEDDPDGEFTCFECDELIAPVILKLNKLGYKTKYCCSGHVYETDVDFEDNRNLNMEKEIFFFDSQPCWSDPYISFNTCIQDIPNLDQLPAGWRVSYTAVSPSDQFKLYKEIGSIGSSEPLDCKYRIILRYNFTKELVFSKFFYSDGKRLKYYTVFKYICKIMEDLYKWVNKLPAYK